MDISRRAFIQTSIAGGAAVTAFGLDVTSVYAQAKTLKIARTSETRSTCPYCSVSCGVIIHTLGDRAKNAIAQVVHVEGDPDHPINRGTLCPKGASLEQDIRNDRRLLKPQVRRPGSRSPRPRRTRQQRQGARLAGQRVRRHAPHGVHLRHRVPEQVEAVGTPIDAVRLQGTGAKSIP